MVKIKNDLIRVRRSAYQSGIIKGHVYEDVVPALERWTSNGKKVYIYSSGSIDAQKLLFGFSEKGDLTNFFSGHFGIILLVFIVAYSCLCRYLNWIKS